MLKVSNTEYVTHEGVRRTVQADPAEFCGALSFLGLGETFMLYGIYQSAAGLLVNQYRMEVQANNLANADTAGFKRDMAVVCERLPQSQERPIGFGASDPRLAGMTGGSFVSPTVTLFEQGPIETTGRPLDVALVGDGFFRVQAEGRELYTRDGRFALNDTGELVTAAGFHAVLDEAGAPIVVPADVRDRLQIGADGQLRAGDMQLARLGVVDFEDHALLRKTGRNLYESLGPQPRPLEQTALKVGAVEKSSVDPVHAMVGMIEVSRAYEFNATLISLADATLGRAVNDVGRVR